MLGKLCHHLTTHINLQHTLTKHFMWALCITSIIAVPLFGEQDKQSKNKPLDSVGQIRQNFDTAMSKPLSNRLKALETAERDLDRKLLEGKIAGKARADALFYKFHIQKQMAKFPDAYATYAERISSIRQVEGNKVAKHALLRDLNRWQLQRDYVMTSSICEKASETFSTDPEIAGSALYHLARAKFWMNGTMDQCVSAAVKLMKEYPQSEWRGKGMRVLANAYFAQGKFDDALATLDLIKQQYPDTTLEHYADMRAAAIWEFGRGDTSKALAIYQQTLQKHPSHFYAPYVHSQIDRVRTVIEQKLIQDTLDNLGKADNPKHLNQRVGIDDNFVNKFSYINVARQDVELDISKTR